MRKVLRCVSVVALLILAVILPPAHMSVDPNKPAGYFAYTGFEVPEGSYDYPHAPNDVCEIQPNLTMCWGNYAYEPDTPDTVRKRDVVPIFGNGTRPTNAQSKIFWMYKNSYAERNVLDIKPGPSWYKEVHYSQWVYVDYVSPSNWTWWQFYEIREYATNGSLSIYLLNNPSRWWFVFGHQPGGYTQPVTFSYGIYPDHIDVCVNGTGATVIANPHEIPYKRWFKLDIYAYRDPTNGSFKVRITDPDNTNPARRTSRILFSIENIETCDANTGDISLQLLKLYGGVNQTKAEISMYSDELYLYNFNAWEMEKSDVNKDRSVDIRDLNLVCRNYDSISPSENLDIDSDGIISISDLKLLGKWYGKSW